MTENNIIPTHYTYIFEHVKDGIMMFDMQGKIIYLNPSAVNCLGLNSSPDKPLALSALLQFDNGKNDVFYQYLFDSIFDKSAVHTGTIPYFLPDNQKRVLQLRTSFWENPENNDYRGILLIFQDITEQEQLRCHRDDAMMIFNILLFFVCSWVVFVCGLNTIGVKIAPYQMTYILLAFGIVITCVIRKKTSITVNHLGLSSKNLKESVIVNTAITIALTLVLVLVKVVLLRINPNFFPAGQPFWFVRVTSLGMLIYPITVFLQEFIARSILQESLFTIFTGKHSILKATLLASLLFAALHIHRSFGYMIGAFFLILIMNPLYIKHRNIWGLCIPHYALCIVSIFLGFI